MDALKQNVCRSMALRIPLFAGISDRGLQRIGTARRLNFQAGEQMLSTADKSDNVFVLITGSAQVVLFSANGKSVSFRPIAPGNLFGEFAAIDGKPRSAVVEAVSACQVLELTGPLFWELVHTEPSFATTVMKHLTELLREMTARIYEFSTLAVKNRIQAALLRMARKEMEISGKPVITPAPKHIEIANRISTHREAVSREMSRLTRLGVIKRDGRSLVIKDLSRLERMVDEVSCE